MVRKLTPKIMKLISENWDIKNVNQDDYFKVLGLAYNIEDTLEKSNEENTLVN